MFNNSKKKVFVGLSGGVDSAVSAALLKEQGFDVTGVYMKNWSGDDYGIQADCPWEKDQDDAKCVADKLGISFRSFNFEKEYRSRVVEYFFSEYEKNRTPNPDVMCNKEIKFKLFLDKAIENGAEFIATGHYAQKKDTLINNLNLRKNSISPILMKGSDSNKDQTYFLYNLTKQQLQHTLFPIGHLNKPEVRKLAKKFNLPNADKPDSQGICFIGEINVLKFLMSRIPEKKGDIIDFDTNKKVGEHKGIYFYTIGQREGLYIGGQSIPYFVVDKETSTNTIYVGHGNDHHKMYKNEVILENFHIINPENFYYKYNIDVNNMKKGETVLNFEASIRYRHKPQPGKLYINNLLNSNIEYQFVFDQPQRAITSGQSLVIFDGEECIGGGIIN